MDVSEKRSHSECGDDSVRAPCDGKEGHLNNLY